MLNADYGLSGKIEVRKDEFDRLFNEFLDSYPETKEGKHHVVAYDEQRKAALENFFSIDALNMQGQDITNDVLVKLLPYSDTSKTRDQGYWISIAPTFSTDVRNKYEAAKWVRPEEWPNIAKAVFHFYKSCYEHPESIDTICSEFEAKGYSKGFQCGVLSPILNALRPNDFLIINKKSRLVINHFAKTSYGRYISDYPRINKMELLLIAELKDIIQKYELPPMSINDVFDMFCHWLVARKKYFHEETDNGGPDSKSDYWQIAPGEKARLWDDLRHNSIAAIGFDEIDEDLTGKSSSEIVQTVRRHYPGYSKRQILVQSNFLNNFLSLKPGDKFVTNMGRSSLLALGVVTGTYKFRNDRPEYKHTIDVNYYRQSKQVIPIPREYKGKFGKTIVPLNRMEFESIEKLFESEPDMNVWWVNQGKSIESEVEEQCI